MKFNNFCSGWKIVLCNCKCEAFIQNSIEKKSFTVEFYHFSVVEHILCEKNRDFKGENNYGIFKAGLKSLTNGSNMIETSGEYIR